MGETRESRKKLLCPMMREFLTDAECEACRWHIDSYENDPDEWHGCAVVHAADALQRLAADGIDVKVEGREHGTPLDVEVRR